MERGELLKNENSNFNSPRYSGIPGVLQIRRLRETPCVGDMLPCGSRGIAWELQVLERETELSVKPAAGLDHTLLQKSAGPATCVIFKASENLKNKESRVIRIGTLMRNT